MRSAGCGVPQKLALHHCAEWDVCDLFLVCELAGKNFLIFSGTFRKGYVVNISVSKLYLSSITNLWEIYSHSSFIPKTPVIKTGFLIHSNGIGVRVARCGVWCGVWGVWSAVCGVP